MFRLILALLLVLSHQLVASGLAKNSCALNYCPEHFEQGLDVCPQSMIESVRPYLHLIPRTFSADCRTCQRCHTLVISSDKCYDCEVVEEYDPDTDEYYEVEECYCYPPENYNCKCCKRFYNVYEGDWDIYKNGEWQWDSVPKEWPKCQQNAWYEGYFYNFYSSQFSFFRHYLQYCAENSECKCLWPELSSLAQGISNETYSCFKKIINDKLIDNEYLPFWQKHLSDHGKTVSLISHTFFYSQYYQSLLDTEKYINQSTMKTAPAASLLIDECLSSIQPKFLELYNQCLSKHPHPKIYYEKGMVLFHMGEAEESLENVATFMDLAEIGGEKDLLTSEMYLQEGNAYIDTLSYDHAIVSLTKAIERDPLNKEAFFKRSIAYFEKGYFNESLDDFLASGFRSMPIDPNLSQDTLMAAGLSEGIVKGGADGVVDLIVSFHGLAHGLWAFAKEPVQASKDFICAISDCVEFIKKSSTPELVAVMVPELSRLIEEWDVIDNYKRGELAGYIIGKHGTEAFVLAGALKGVKFGKRLADANTILTLEAIAASPVNKNAIVTTANKIGATSKKLRAFTRNNYRHNLIVTTGIDPKLAMQAHHVFPQKFRGKLALKGINIDDPKYLTWWTTEGTNSHQKMASSYSKLWERFLQKYPEATEAQILEEGRKIMQKFGRDVNY